MKKLFSLLVACAVAVATTHATIAHGGHDERMKIRMAEGRLVFETHISAKILKLFDRDGNGVLTVAEFYDKAPEIKEWIGSHIEVSSSGGSVLQPVFFDTPISEGDMSTSSGEVKFVRILQHYDQGTLEELDIIISLFANEDRSVLLFKGGKIYHKKFRAGVIKMALN